MKAQPLHIPLHIPLVLIKRFITTMTPAELKKKMRAQATREGFESLNEWMNKVFEDKVK